METTTTTTTNETKDLKENSSCIDSFDDLDLKENLLRGIYAYGYESPSAIQSKAILPFLKGFDIVANAQSGTGKTATFSIGVLNGIKEDDDSIQAIILAPTRELAQQIYSVMCDLSHYMGVRIGFVSSHESFYTNVDNEIVQKRPHILVATPGRLSHVCKEAFVNPKNIQYIILDEADHLLSADFESQVWDIITYCSKDCCQIGLYTATVTERMRLNSVPRILRNPVWITVKKEELTLEGIRQFYISLSRSIHKFEVLLDIYKMVPALGQVIIYCNRVNSCESLARFMNDQDIPVETIHARRTAQERSSVMKDFRAGHIRVLVATDLLCRGIDVQQVSFVINFDFPFDRETYLHRIGRSGRFGRKGVALNFIITDERGNQSADEESKEDIEKYYATQFQVLPEDVSEALTI
jgi:translation initiation factor 4A